MKTFVILCAFMLSSLSFAQKVEIEEFMNQFIDQEISEDFDYFFLIPESVKNEPIRDSLTKFEITRLRFKDRHIPFDFLYQTNTEKVNWKNYALKKARYRPENHHIEHPRNTKHVVFVDYRISDKEYDSLFKLKKPGQILVRKKKLWSKKRIYKNDKFYAELRKAWDKDEEENLQDRIYYQFSKPIFSKDFQYAQITFISRNRCGGTQFNTVYKKVNGKWKKLIEYNHLYSMVTYSHFSCRDMSITFDD